MHHPDFFVIYHFLPFSFEHHPDFLYPFTSGVYSFKSQRPRVYLTMTVGVFLLTAWIGSSFGDTFICYGLALFALLYPGAKKNGIVETYFAKILDVLKENIGKDKFA